MQGEPATLHGDAQNPPLPEPVLDLVRWTNGSGYPGAARARSALRMGFLCGLGLVSYCVPKRQEWSRSPLSAGFHIPGIDRVLSAGQGLRHEFPAAGDLA